MGWVALAAGDEDEAERMVAKAAAALRGACPWLGVLGLYIRGIVAVRRHNPDAAIASVRESLAVIRRVHDKYAFVHIMVPFAAAAILKRDGAWAARIVAARDAVAERTEGRVVDGLAQDLLSMVEREGRTSLGPERWGTRVRFGTHRLHRFAAERYRDRDHVDPSSATLGRHERSDRPSTGRDSCCRAESS